MNSPDNTMPILVAIDGSESALRAAHWAAAEATRRGRGLSIVHAYDWPLPNYRPVVVDAAALHESVVNTARASLAAAVTSVTEVAPALPVTAEIISGPAVAVLLGLTRRGRAAGPRFWRSSDRRGPADRGATRADGPAAQNRAGGGHLLPGHVRVHPEPRALRLGAGTRLCHRSGPDAAALVAGVLEMIVALACIATAVVLYPVVKRQNQGAALGFVAVRVLEAGAILAGVVAICRS